MDIGTIILVIGLVEMLKFLYKNGDLGGLNKNPYFFSGLGVLQCVTACVGVVTACALSVTACNPRAESK